MPHRRCVLWMALVLVISGSAAAEDPKDATTDKLTPWAVARKVLRVRTQWWRLPTDRGSSASDWKPRLKPAPAAVDAALTWLAAHQSPDGRWEAAGFSKRCNGNVVPETERADGAGLAIYDVGVSGLALNAFLVAGYTGGGKYAFDETVRRGIAYLMKSQDKEGCFGARVVSPLKQVAGMAPNPAPPPPLRPGERVRQRPGSVAAPAYGDRKTFVYNHAIASLAIVEAYGLTGNADYKEPAQRALDFIARARNSHFAWRYGVAPGDNDTSVSGWMMLPLVTAQRINMASSESKHPAPFKIDAGAIDGLRTWIGKATDPEYGRVGYIVRGGELARQDDFIDRFPSDNSLAMTAVGVLARVFMGEDPRRSKLIKMGTKLCEKLPPTWNERNGSIDMIYWHYGTLAMHQVGGKAWTKWWRAVVEALLEGQRKDTTISGAKGSWDPIGAWGKAGGRVYATAICALTLLSRIRYKGRGR